MMSTNLLSGYASFLLEYHLDNFAQWYLKRNKEMNQTAMNFYTEPDETKLINQIKKESRLFLELLAKSHVVDFNIEWLNSLNTITTPLSRIENATASDSILAQHNRKLTLIHFLPAYTQNGEEIIEIIKRLEELLVMQEVYIVQYFSDQSIKEDLLGKTEALAHSGYCELNYSNGTVKCSDGFRKIIGIDSDTRLTIDSLKNRVIQQNGFNPFEGKRSQSFKEKEVNAHEFKIRCEVQGVKVLRSHDYPLKDENGDIIGMKSFFQDITDIKHIEDQVKENKSQIQNILDSSPTVIGIYDTEEDRIVYTNWKKREFFGFTKEIFMKDYSNFIDKHIHPDDKSKLAARRKEYQQLKEGEYKAFVFRIIDSKGDIHWFNSKAIMFKKANGKVKQVLYNAVDITELKKVEGELRDRETQLLETQKIANIGSFEWDIKNDEFTGTDEVFRIFGFSRNEKLVLSKIRTLIHKDDKRTFEDNLRMALHAKNPFEAEYKIVLPDKTIKCILARTKTLLNDSGELVKMLGSVMDITSLKKTEKKLKERNEELKEAYDELENAQHKLEKTNSELEERVRMRTKELKKSTQLYHSFIEQNSVGVWLSEFKDIGYIDTTLPVEEQVKLIYKYSYTVEANERLAKMFGYQSAKEFVGRKVIDLISVSKEKVLKLYSKGIMSGYRLDEEDLEAKDVNGNIIYVKTSVIGIVEDKKLVRGWGILRDITDRKFAIEALKESEERYRVLTESVPSIFWSADMNGKIDYYNQSWYDYTGMTREEYGKDDWPEFVHPDDLQKTLDAWEKGFNANESFETEYRLKRFDGEYHWHLCKALPLKDEEGRIIKWMGTSTDIDVQKHFSEILEEKNEELARLNNDLDNFIYSASHDLKGPVNNLEGLLEELNTELDMESKDEEATGTILNMMSGSIDKFRKNLLGLIEITKARQRGEEGVEENYLDDMLKEVESTVEDLIEKSGARIISDFHECPVIKFSAKNLQSIIYNLLSNAIKYRSEDRQPEIIVSTKELKNYILLSVQDNGIGFEEEQIDKVFSQYKRFQHNVEGSGVGLFIVKRIVDSAGGKIELESKKGKGSLFKVYFRKE